MLGEFEKAVALAPHDNDLSTLAAQMSVVRLHDAWDRFCRELVVVSAAETPITASGVKLARAPNIRARTDVIPVLLRTYRNRRYEPRWASPQECIDAASRLSVSNRSIIAGAIGVSNSPIDEIRVIRNFFVHKSLTTANEVRAIAAFGPITRLDVISLVAVAIGPGHTRMHRWISLLQSIAALAIQ